MSNHRMDRFHFKCLIKQTFLRYKRGFYIDAQALDDVLLFRRLSLILMIRRESFIQSLFDYNRPFGRVWSSRALVHVIETEYVFRLELVVKQDIICRRKTGGNKNGYFYGSPDYSSPSFKFVGCLNTCDWIKANLNLAKSLSGMFSLS
jgi:hypothetical protein